MIRKHIPNIITLGNLACGIFSSILLAQCLLLEAFDISVLPLIFLLMWASLILDFLDGLVARLLKVQSKIGKELDSLADMVSFGLVPGLALMLCLKNSELPFENAYYLGGIITLFSALRLAKFNVDDTQTENFKGLATPSVTIFIVTLAYSFFKHDFWVEWIPNAFLFFSIIGIIFSLLLVSDIPMFSFKLKDFSWKKNFFRYILLLAAIPLLVLFYQFGLVLIIIIYIVLSLIFKKHFT